MAENQTTELAISLAVSAESFARLKLARIVFEGGFSRSNFFADGKLSLTEIVTSMRFIQRSPEVSNYVVVANLKRHIDKPLDVSVKDGAFHSLVQRREDQFERKGN